MVECVAYVMGGRDPARGAAGSSLRRRPPYQGISFGPGILGFVEEYYMERCTDQTISYFFEEIYGFAL